MVPNIYDHIQTQTGVCCYGFVHPSVELYNDWLKIRTFSPRTESDTWAISLRVDTFLERIDSQVHPKTFKCVLYYLNNARFASARSAI